MERKLVQRFKAPKYKEFAVNGKVVVEGNIEDYSQLKEDYLWIKVTSTEEGPAGNQHEYYTGIEDGKFKQDIHFLMEKGNIRFRCRYLVKTVKIIFMTQLILKLIM